MVDANTRVVLPTMSENKPSFECGLFYVVGFKITDLKLNLT